MATDMPNAGNIPDAGELTATLGKIAEQSQRMVTDFMARQTAEDGQMDTDKNQDPLNIGDAFLQMTQRMMDDPARLAEAQVGLWNNYMELWQHTANKMMGQNAEPLVKPETDDRRFLDSDWEENPVFDFIKQSYLMTSKWMINSVRETDGLDDETARKVDFYTRQFVDAMAPTNFAMTNPEVLRETVDSKGQNLINGLSNLLDDLERGDGQLKIKHVEEDAFEIGVTVATSPGKVVFQNELFQLLQFSPLTKKVRKMPLLIVPPWINKYYILDLREKNSFIKWATEQGHTVFVVSWVNPDARLGTKTFEDYMLDGPVAAVGAACNAAGSDKVNIIGYCIGGTMTAAALAYMAEKGDDRVASATFFTTMVDFEEPGELGVFIDEEQLASLEDKMGERGYLEGSEMASTFSMLRANDLIWSFVINNYLLGKEPFPFDLLFWNADSTRMPAVMHSYYLRKMYQENALVKPGALELGGVKIDLRKIKVPVYILSTKEDHIAPWKSTFAATQIYSGNTKFVLASSGHIAGVVNPPVSDRYSYRTNAKKAKTPAVWLEGATEHKGSWWPDWDKWVKKFAGTQVAAREPGKGKFKAIEDAPGSYVKVRSSQES
ncbi:MAG: class I poly(R)-hydroxyalkanoic acid synthase [Alphaproteobacteria bacterium]|nr:class I poly(R)-hydroxyalkanoic acid synthase [Alphaproteobacteria bacterium]